MPNAPHSFERTMRARSSLFTALEDFCDKPNEARTADLLARIHEYRDAVQANVLPLPHVLRKDTYR